MTDTTAPPTTNRRRGRPSGAPSRSKATTLVNKLIRSNKSQIKDILQTVIDLAHTHKEQWAIELLAERVWPKPAGRTVIFPMPRLTSAADCAACLDALMQATAAGALTPAECAQLSTVVSRTGEALAAKGIEERLEALEAAGKPQQITSYRKIA